MIRLERFRERASASGLNLRLETSLRFWEVLFILEARSGLVFKQEALVVGPVSLYKKNLGPFRALSPVQSPCWHRPRPGPD